MDSFKIINHNGRTCKRAEERSAIPMLTRQKVVVGNTKSFKCLQEVSIKSECKYDKYSVR